MAILDMIPPEYWRQLRKELNALDWDAIKTQEDAERQQAEQHTARHFRSFTMKRYAGNGESTAKAKRGKNSRERHKSVSVRSEKAINFDFKPLFLFG